MISLFFPSFFCTISFFFRENKRRKTRTVPRYEIANTVLSNSTEVYEINFDIFKGEARGYRNKFSLPCDPPDGAEPRKLFFLFSFVLWLVLPCPLSSCSFFSLQGMVTFCPCPCAYVRPSVCTAQFSRFLDENFMKGVFQYYLETLFWVF